MDNAGEGSSENSSRVPSLYGGTGSRLPSPSDNGSRLPVPSDSNGSRLPSPSDNGSKLPVPSDSNDSILPSSSDDNSNTLSSLSGPDTPDREKRPPMGTEIPDVNEKILRYRKYSSTLGRAIYELNHRPEIKDAYKVEKALQVVAIDTDDKDLNHKDLTLNNLKRGKESLDRHIAMYKQLTNDQIRG
jgi:hypothetical protein